MARTKAELSFDSFADFPTTGSDNVLYIATDTNDMFRWDGSQYVQIGAPGDVDGPASSTDNAIARYDGTTGKILQDSSVLIDDSDNMSGAESFSVTTPNTANVVSATITNNDVTNDTAHLEILGTSTGVAMLINSGVVGDNRAVRFGDGVDGLHQQGEGNVRLTSGTIKWQWLGDFFSSTNSNGGKIRRAAASSTMPTLIPYGNTTTSGMGGDTDGTVYLITASLPVATLDLNQGISFSGRVKQAKGADVASATDVTLGFDGNYFDITGTTTIDTIVATGWTAGSIIYLQFDASVTVSHNTAGTGASILLVAGGFSATAGDTLVLAFDGTTWRELSRSAI